jgi:hypothetical protein
LVAIFIFLFFLSTSLHFDSISYNILLAGLIAISLGAHHLKRDLQFVIPLNRENAVALISLSLYPFACKGLPRLRLGQDILVPLPERDHLRPARLRLPLVAQCRLRIFGKLLQSQRPDWHLACDPTASR